MPNEGRDSFASYRERLDALGFTPSRRLGQNFLLDPSLHRVLVEAVCPQTADLVLEVGAGLGFLTRVLAESCRVVAVEVDNRLQGILAAEREGYPGGGETVQLVNADALVRSRINPVVLEAVARARSTQPAQSRFMVVANLPYAIAGPLLAELAALAEPPSEMAVLIQLELAQRISAVPGTREYGALAVQLQLAYRPRLLRRVGAQVFRPRPKVDSAMVHLEPREDGSLHRSAEERREMGVFWRHLFASRRKKLRNAKVLQGKSGSELSAAILDCRPDTVAPEDLLALWDQLATDRP